MPKPTAPPDLRRAWNFYYGRTLPRRAKDPEEPDGWRKLESVEPGGELYPLNTPLGEMLGFGVGTALYLGNRIAAVLVFTLIGLLNSLTIMAYYKSAEYDPKGRKSGYAYDLRASAMCDATHKVCMDWECSTKQKVKWCPFFRFEDGECFQRARCLEGELPCPAMPRRG